MPPKRRVSDRRARSNANGQRRDDDRNMVRPNLASVDPRALLGAGAFVVGSRVRILGNGLHAGESATVEQQPGGVIPSAVVRTDSGHTRRVRTIDLEAI